MKIRKSIFRTCYIAKMSLLDQLEKIQKKPEPTRQKIMVAAVIIIMAAIILIWSSTIDLSLEKTDYKQTQKTGAKDYNSGPFIILKKSFASATETIKEIFKENIYTK